MPWQTHGFEFIKKYFEQIILNDQPFDYAQDKLSHAYIFFGQEMIGKRTFALELSYKINGSKTEGSTNPDVYLVSPNSSKSGRSITIDEIRKVRQFLYLSTMIGPRKFVIIDDADQMTVEAQNAFLKALEEPSASSVIFLITAYPDVLLSTILSRCQTVNFPNHSKTNIETILVKEGVENAKAKFLAEFSNGRLGLALKIIRENQYSQIKNYLKELADLIKSNMNGRLVWAKKISEADNSTTEIGDRLLTWMLYLRIHKDSKNLRILAKLMRANHDLLQPQYNTRLLLENLVIQL